VNAIGGTAMQIILKTEEDFARFQRRLIHDLPDNQVEDEISRFKFLETRKMIVTDVQFTRMACRSFAKLSSEEKRQARERIRWTLLYDSKVNWGVIH
jgi:hypothetical protein